MYGPQRYKLREPQSKDGTNRGEATKCKLRSLQCPAPKCARQTPEGQTSIYGRTVDFDQRCAACGRPEYRRARQSSVQTETDRKRNASRYPEASSQAHSSSLAEAEVFDESAREQRPSGLLLKDWRRQTQKTNQGSGAINAIVRHDVGVGASRASSDAFWAFGSPARFCQCGRARWDVLRIRSQSKNDGESYA